MSRFWTVRLGGVCDLGGGDSPAKAQRQKCEAYAQGTESIHFHWATTLKTSASSDILLCHKQQKIGKVGQVSIE